MERGRPRQFAEADALEAAMRIFWRDGYRGASMAELTSAMGINKPSLYAAFGGKEQLYLRALQHYGETRAMQQVAALDKAANIRDAIGGFLKRSVDRGCSKDEPGGCYVVNALADCGTAATPMPVADATRHAFGLSQGLLKARLKRAMKEGELAADTDIPALVNLIVALMAGMAVMARNGASKAALHGVVDEMLKGLPLTKSGRR